MNLANEGLEARKKDEEVAQRKRKAEEDKTWEGTLLPIHILLLPTYHTSVVYRNSRTACRQLAQLFQYLQEKEKDQNRFPWIIHSP